MAGLHFMILARACGRAGRKGGKEERRKGGKEENKQGRQRSVSAAREGSDGGRKGTAGMQW
jgi:hypothetical protein